MRIPADSALILFIAISSFALAGQACYGTPQHPPTTVKQIDGKWRLLDDYVGGSAIVLRHASEKVALRLKIADALSKEDYETYVRISTAGPIWSTYAISYVTTLDSSPHFCVRTWWGRRILLNLNEAKQVSDEPFNQQLNTIEKQRALQYLRTGVAPIPSSKTAPNGRVTDVRAATHLAGVTSLKAAIPLLKKLEHVYAFNSSISSGGIVDTYSLDQTRRIVQLSLRRLGVQPQGTAPVRLEFAEKHPAVALELRHERTPRLKPGMKPIDVINSIGPPDYIEFDFHDSKLNYQFEAWRYDIDASEPYTLWISWRADDTVAEIKKFEPALWKGRALFNNKPAELLFEADGSIIAAEKLYTRAFKGTATKLK